MENLYDILGVTEDATKEEIKRAYASKIRSHTPEKDSEMFKKVREAYEILIDSQSRAEYDERIRYEKDGHVELEKYEETLYDILEIDSEATSKEIKKSYATKIRIHTPEKDPDMFEKIKNAYETLINEEAREEYDLNLKYGEEIRQYKIKVVEAWNCEDYKTVIKWCKKILNLNKNLNEYLYRLSLALYYDNEIDEAIKYAIELVDMCPEQYEYHKHIAILYMDKEQYTRAESYFISAHEIQPLDETVITYLIDTYIYSGRHKKGIIFLQDNIENNLNNKYINLLYYENLIRIYINLKELEEIDNVIDSMEHNLISQENDKKDVADKLYEIAIDAYKKELYQVAEIVAKRSKELFEDEYVNNLYENIKSNLQIYNLYTKLEQDQRIIKEVKEPLYYYIYSYKSEDQSKAEEDFDKNIDQIEKLVHKKPGEVAKSIVLLKRHYIELFNYGKDLYEDILKRSESIQMLQEQYEAMDKDFQISLGIYHLVELWMDYEISDEQRKIRFEEIKEEINEERPLQVYNSLIRIKDQYFKIYDLNPDAIDEMEENLRPLAKQKKKANLHRHDSHTSNSQNTDEEPKAGCFSIILGIIFIAVLGPSILSGVIIIGGAIIQLIVYALILVAIVGGVLYVYNTYFKK
ncbi:DnaJ domain-containing protein [Romboutsia sp.]|uniref:DnaJ domain-containing protein n=1 Tax=Romboutsia sp. TaxID=1965302 RepID=UPI003F400DF7